MGCIIAMAGKGGTGKTTVASLIIRAIRDKKLGSILAIDADPNSNLAETLGVEVKETIADILEEISAKPEIVPVNMGKDSFIEYRLQTAIVEGEGFDCLTMGKPEGPGCYCYVNNVLRNIMDKLIKDYDFIVIDNEAGLEHLSRRTTRRADSLVVISDATTVGLKAARRIKELTRNLNIKVKSVFLIVNRCDENILGDKLAGLDMHYLGYLPKDKEIESASLNGGSLAGIRDNNITLNNLRTLGEKIWHCN